VVVWKEASRVATESGTGRKRRHKVPSISKREGANRTLGTTEKAGRGLGIWTSCKAVRERDTQLNSAQSAPEEGKPRWGRKRKGGGGRKTVGVGTNSTLNRKLKQGSGTDGGVKSSSGENLNEQETGGKQAV